MKLVTPQGQLDLPEDFSLTIERTNPLLSDEGDRSIPVTLPATPKNLAILGHKERIDRAYRYTNKADAILQVGPVQKRGQLVIDSVQRHGGIDAVFAIDNSDLYVSSKEKSLKEILADDTYTWGSVEASMDVMQDCLDGDETYDYRVFPVGVSSYEDDGVTVYQVNNDKDSQGNIVWQARMVHEGGIDMAVPDGYGVTPFLKLHVLISKIFTTLGYTVTENCFDDHTASTPLLSRLTILHNCSDCLCAAGTVTLHVADMVPSCTLSEFLGWLLAKFHAATVIDSQAKTVRVVMMEQCVNTTLQNATPVDGLVVDDPKMGLSTTKRIVLTPTNSIEGTEPAAESFDELVAKYGGYVAANEVQFQSLTTSSPAFTDCLVLRKSTGVFYLITYDINTGNRTLEKLGTNHFAYDRHNSDETEEFSQMDVMPLMLCGVKAKTDVMPYIGDRLHYHTYVKEDPDEEKSDEQPIIVVQAKYSSSFANVVTGTTQRYIPLATTGEYDLTYGLVNFDAYQKFWSTYNILLRNNATHVTGQMRLTLTEFLNLDMVKMMGYKGKGLLPIALSSAVSDKMALIDFEALLVNLFHDVVYDTPITPIASNGLTWQVSSDAEDVGKDLFDYNQQAIEEDALAGYGPSWDVYSDPEYLGATVSFGQTTLSPGMPMYLGETKELPVQATVTVNYRAELYDTQYPGERHVFVEKGLAFANQMVTFTFVAVAVTP